MQTVFLCNPEECAGVLGKTGPPVSRPGMEKFTADPAVQTDALGKGDSIGPNRFADIGHFVDETYFDRQKGIGGILDEFRSLDV